MRSPHPAQFANLQVMIHFERKRQSAAEVSYHVRFTSCMLIGKLALSACSALLVDTVRARRAGEI